MTEYRFHWWPTEGRPQLTSSVSVNAESRLHGAALALREFAQQGCDIAAPLAHVDVTESDGSRHTLLVDEVVSWLNEPQQSAFVARERLATLFG